MQQKLKFPIVTICDNIRSLYNVGAIFRTSDAADIEKIYLCGITGYPKNDHNWFQTARIEKTALGATKTVSWQYCKNVKLKVQNLKYHGYKIYALEIDSRAKPYNEVKYQFPCALVVGHETEGINLKILDLADEIIQIPMYGSKTSLNVGVAYAIALYEIIKNLPNNISNHKNLKNKKLR